MPKSKTPKNIVQEAQYINNTRQFFNDLYFHFHRHNHILEYISGEKTPHLLLNFKKNKFDLKLLLKICERIQINLDQLILNDVPWNKVKNLFFKMNRSCIPDYYLKHAGTKISVIEACLNFISFSFNSSTMNMLLNKLELHPSSFYNSETLVNVVMVNKFLNLCSKHLSLGHGQFRSMALYTNLKTQRNQIIQSAKLIKTDKDLLQLMVNHSNQYEINFDYQLKSKENLILITSQGKEEIHDGLKLTSLNYLEAILFKRFTMESTNFILGRSPMQILKIDNKKYKGKQRIKFYIKENNSFPSNSFMRHGDENQLPLQ